MKYYLTVLVFMFFLLTNAQTRLSFTYDNAGNQTIRVVCINCSSKPAREVKEIEALVEEDLEKFSEEDAISYYPNPVKEELYLRWQLLNDVYVNSIQIFTMTGQMVREYQPTSKINNQNIPFQSYPTGVYLVLLQYSNGSQKSIKIIKK